MNPLATATGAAGPIVLFGPRRTFGSFTDVVGLSQSGRGKSALLRLPKWRVRLDGLSRSWPLAYIECIDESNGTRRLVTTPGGTEAEVVPTKF